MDNSLRSRALKKKIQVSFSDGTVVCYKNATTTFVEAIKKIGPALFAEAGLEIGHLPIVSTECHEKYKKYMMPLTDGWWVNTQSDSSQKYLQLLSAKNKLGFDYEVKMADVFDDYSEAEKRQKRKTDTICVVFGENDIILDNYSEDVFVAAIERIGATRILQRCLEFQGKDIVTRYNKYPKQRKLESGEWVTIPLSTKEMRNAINYINAKLNLGIEALSITDYFNRMRNKLFKTE